MSIKIKAPFVWVNPLFTIYQSKDTCGQQNYRLVRESDWRKLMRLVRAADDHVCWQGVCTDALKPREVCDIRKALNALEKKK